MKRLLIIALCLLSIAGYSQDYYYWYKGSKIQLERGNQLFIIYEDDFLSESDKAKIAYSEDVFYDEIPNLKWGTTKPDAVIEDKEHVHYSMVSFKKGKDFGDDMFVTHRFYVKLKSDKDLETLQSLANENSAEIEEDIEGFALWYVLRCKLDASHNALELANMFYETGLFTYSEPEIINALEAAGLEHNAEQEPSKTKVIKDGKLLIISGDKKFSPTGAEVR